MPTHLPAFRIALSGLLAACGLLLGVAAVRQFVPTDAAKPDKSAATAGRKSAPAVAPPTIQTASRHFTKASFSGSATSNAGETDSDVPAPPIDDVAYFARPATVDDLDRVEYRIEELERRTVTDRADRADDRFLQLIEGLQQQGKIEREIAARIDQLERQVEFAGDAPRETDAAVSIRAFDDSGALRWVVHAREASLPQFLARLGEAAGMNLVVSPEVAGTVSLHLCESDADAVLDVVCKIHRCRVSRSGNFVVVSAEHERAIDIQATSTETISKLYRLRYLSGSEVRDLVQPLLTPGVGTCGFAALRERTPRSPQAFPQAVLVKDTARVMAEIDRLILELDRPAGSESTTSVTARAQSPSVAPPSNAMTIAPHDGFDPPITVVNPIRSRD